MLRNVASQKWRVYAWDTTTGLAKTGDAANISAHIRIDDGVSAATNDTAPTEASSTNEPGYYDFDLTQAETNGAKLSLAPKSGTANIQVVACPPVIHTRPQYFSLLGIASDGDLSKVNLLDGHTAQTGDSFAVVSSGTHGNAALKALIDIVGDFIDTEIALILSHIGTPSNLGTGANLSANLADIEAQTDDIGTAGAGLTAIPWNAAWDAEVQSEVDDALIAKGLDHLVFAAVTGADITDNSIIARLVSSSAIADWDTFVNTTDSLQALRDRGDAAWITATGFSTHAAADVWAAAGRTLTALGFVLGPSDLAADTITAAKVAADVHEELLELAFTYGATANYATANAGSLVKQTADNAGGSGLTAAGIADAVWDEILSGHVGAGSTGEALNAAGGAGDPWITFLPGAYTSGQAGNVLGNLLASLAAAHGAGSWATATGFSTLDASGVRAAVGLAAANLDTQLTAIVGDTNELQTDWANNGRLDVILDARASQASVDAIGILVDAILVDTGTDIPATLATIASYLDTEIAAIKAKTDQLTFTNANKVDAATLAAADFATVVAEKLADIIIRRTRQNVKASLNGDTLDKDSLYGAIARLMKFTVSGSTGTLKHPDGTTLGTLPVASDANANPITGIGG